MRCAIVWVCWLGACAPQASGPDGVTDDTDDPAPSGITYHADVRPIVEASCFPCHDDGGVGPFSMTFAAEAWADGAPAWAVPAVAAVVARTMPPWKASDDCHPIEGSKRLADDDVATFEAWRDEGFVQGRAQDFVPRADPPGRRIDAPPDLVFSAEAPYTANPLLPDDYRCLPLGEPISQQTFLRGIQVQPDQRAVVHHAIVYAVNPEKAAEVAALDEGEPGVGYTCFGGPLRSDPGIEGSTYQNLYTWVPGIEPEVLAEGDARRLVAGSQLVLQVHYNTLSLGGAPIPADQTTVAMWRYDGARPLGLIQTVPLANYGIRIEPGDPASRHEQTFRFGTQAVVVGAMAHMHNLGSALAVEVERGTGGTECLLDVPEWDFDWQQGYAFPVSEPFVLRADDTVKLTCTYDNSAANQPVVNGEQQEPRLVTWGEGTLDEMCLAYALVRYPGGIDGDGDCGPFRTCFGACQEGDGACLATCLAGAVGGCGTCGVQQLGACAASSCGLQFLGLDACLDTCDDDPLRCLVTECRAETEVYLSCQDPFVRSGACNRYLETCGVTF